MKYSIAGLALVTMLAACTPSPPPVGLDGQPVAPASTAPTSVAVGADSSGNVGAAVGVSPSPNVDVVVGTGGAGVAVGTGGGLSVGVGAGSRGGRRGGVGFWF